MSDKPRCRLGLNDRCLLDAGHGGPHDSRTAMTRAIEERADVPEWLVDVLPCEWQGDEPNSACDCLAEHPHDRSQWCKTCDHRFAIAAHPEFIAICEKAEALPPSAEETASGYRELLYAAAQDGTLTAVVLSEIREAERLAEQRRDQRWSAALETGFSDCPPRNPDEVGDWWRRHFADVERTAREAENARRDAENTGGVDGPVIRRRIMDCPEHVGENGHCECSSWIASQLALAEERGREQAAKYADTWPAATSASEYAEGWNDAADGLAAAIRALPSEPPESTDAEEARLWTAPGGKIAWDGYDPHKRPGRPPNVGAAAQSPWLFILIGAAWVGVLVWLVWP